MAAVAQAIAAEPLFSGTNTNGHVSAEMFLTHLQSVRDQAGLTDLQTIARARGNMREPASEWFASVVPCRTSGVDGFRMRTEWDYFMQQFKLRWFAVRDPQDAIADISSLRQRPSESMEDFFDRLVGALHRMYDEADGVLERAAPARDYLLGRPQLLVNHVADPVAHPLVGAALQAQLDLFAAHHYVQGVRDRSDAAFYAQVARAAANTAKDEKMRVFLREKIFTCNTIAQLRAVCREKERSLRPLPDRATNDSRRGAVHAVDDEASDSEEDSSVDAIGQRKSKKPWEQRGKKKDAPAAKTPSSDAPAAGGSYCIVCKRPGHDIKDCRTLANILSTREAARQQNPGRGRGGRRGRGGKAAAAAVEHEEQQAGDSHSSVQPQQQPQLQQQQVFDIIQQALGQYPPPPTSSAWPPAGNA